MRGRDSEGLGFEHPGSRLIFARLPLGISEGDERVEVGLMPAMALCSISVAASYIATTQLWAGILTSLKLDRGLRSEWPCERPNCTAGLEHFRLNNSSTTMLSCLNWVTVTQVRMPITDKRRTSMKSNVAVRKHMSNQTRRQQASTVVPPKLVTLDRAHVKKELAECFNKKGFGRPSRQCFSTTALIVLIPGNLTLKTTRLRHSK